MPKVSGPQILTANHLLSGEVVFWTGDGWSPDHRDAEVFPEAAEQQAALKMAEAASDIVVGPYLAAVAADNPTPTHFREAIRTRGPTVRTDLGKQAQAQALQER